MVPGKSALYFPRYSHQRSRQMASREWVRSLLGRWEGLFRGFWRLLRPVNGCGSMQQHSGDTWASSGYFNYPEVRCELSCEPSNFGVNVGVNMIVANVVPRPPAPLVSEKRRKAQSALEP